MEGRVREQDSGICGLGLLGKLPGEPGQRTGRPEGAGQGGRPLGLRPAWSSWGRQAADPARHGSQPCRLRVPVLSLTPGVDTGERTLVCCSEF